MGSRQSGIANHALGGKNEDGSDEAISISSNWVDPS
jgi:hypothetical protein